MKLPNVKLTFFLQVKPFELFTQLQSVGFTVARANELVWQNGESSFRIVPFGQEGRLQCGYRIYFQGSVDALAFLLDRSVYHYEAQLTGVEWIYESNLNQDQLVRMVEKNRFKRSEGLYGSYEKDGISAILMPSGHVHLQLRNRHIPFGSILKIVRLMENIGEVFLPVAEDLFSTQGVLVG